MFVINPDPYSAPSFRIGPFRSDDIARNNALPDDGFAAEYFDRRFGRANWQYTNNGREAIQLALESYGLDKNDLVTILTTSQNFYISSCVTKRIEAICKWNRALVPETKLIFVNHEFGYPYPQMERLVDTGLPIIEDCCTTFFSQDDFGKTGFYGDFSLYSFPKFFPIQIGGLLVSNKDKKAAESRLTTREETTYAQKALSYYLRQEASLLQKRKENFNYAVALFSKLGFTQRFQISEKTVPSALMLNNNGIIHNLDVFKIFLNNNGIQASVFYGEDAFFIPNHQKLLDAELDYFEAVVSYFITSQNK